MVRIAVAVPLSGPLAADGRGILRAVEMAVADSKPIETPPTRIEVRGFDDMSLPEEAAKTAEQIVADKEIVAVVGHLTSGCALTASRVYAKAGIPMITPSATNPELTLQQTRSDWSGPRVVFRLPPSDEIQGAFAAEYAFDRLNIRSFSVLHDKTPYGQGLAEEFRKKFVERGGKVVSFEGVPKGGSDFHAVLEWASRFKPGGLFFGGDYNEAGLIFRQARSMQMTCALMAGDGSKAPEIFQIAGPAVDGALFVVGGVPVEHLPSAIDFTERYKERYKGQSSEPRTFDHYAYESTRILVESLRTSLDRRIPLLDALHDIRYESMMGTIIFDHKGDTTKRLMTMTRASYDEKKFKPAY